MVLLVGAVGFSPAEAQQDPDSAVTIPPIMVRVLRSTIGTGAPYAVSAVSGPELTRGAAGAFLEEALRAVPGVQVQNRFNPAMGERLAVRGFGSRAQFGVRGVRILVDGIPATLPDGQATLDHLDLAGLGRVEVLRGPNATLYGNAAGGVLHFRTLDPADSDAYVSARATGGTHDLTTLQGVASGHWGDTGYRFSVSRLSFDGYRRDPVADDGSVYGVAKRLVFNGMVTTPLAGGNLRLVANGVDLDAENPGSLSATLLEDGDRSAFRFNVLNGTRKDVNQGQIGASWSGPLGGAEAELATWAVSRELDNPIPSDVIGLDRKAGGVRALVSDQFPVSVGALSIGGGVEVELQNDDRREWDNVDGDPGVLLLSQKERVRGVGLFMQGRMDIGSSLSVVGGLRYDRARFSVDDRFTTGDPDDSGVRTMDAFSPSAGVLVEAVDGVEIFGSVARSFETPTTTELGNRASGAGGFNPDLQNVGESHHSGWELSVDGRPVPGTSLRVAYTRIDARFDVFIKDGEDHSGNRVPGLAPYRLDMLGQVDAGPGFVELRGLYQDEVPVDDGGMFKSAPHFVADLRVGFEDVPAGGVWISPYAAVANLFDRRYNSSVIVNAFGSRYFEPGPGRTYRFGLGLTWRR
jgi:iron complex outermembrane receptor protein